MAGNRYGTPGQFWTDYGGSTGTGYSQPVTEGEGVWTGPNRRQFYRDEGEDLTDSEVREQVLDRIQNDRNISPRDKSNIQVIAETGVVTLSGTVTSRRAKWQAYTNAYWSPGVSDVLNKLTVSKIRTKGGK